MAQTREFKALAKRLLQLEQDFLPATRISGAYTGEEQDCIRAYRLLSHAEFEYFFEQAALEIVKRAHAKYRLTTVSNKVLNALSLSTCSRAEPTKGSNRFDEAVKMFQESVKKNHGIKEKNLCGLLLPLGLDYTKLDVTWLNTMNSFGLRRGEIAHTSASVGRVLDPVVEKGLISQVLIGTGTLDQDLKKLRL